jgi:transposase
MIASTMVSETPRNRSTRSGGVTGVTTAYAATAQAHARLIIALNEQIATMEEQVKARFLAHPDAEIYLSMPGIAEITGARVLAESGDDPTRYASAKDRKNYAGTSPITRASGNSHTVRSRYVRNNRLADALQRQAFCALRTSPGTRRYYDKQRAREAGYIYVGYSRHSGRRAGSPTPALQ